MKDQQMDKVIGGRRHFVSMKDSEMDKVVAGAAKFKF
jgi:hypothetical protein